MEYDFAQDIDPIEFIVEEEVAFLHRIKPFVRLAGNEHMEDRKVLALSRTAARQLNQYRIVLACCPGRMPSDEAEQLLSELLDYMKTAWDGRHTLKRDMVPVIDNICMAYSKLATYLKSETPE